MYSFSGTDEKETQKRIYDPSEWSRAGRGLELQFFATDADMRECFLALPQRYEPYAIWGSRLVERNGQYAREAFSYSLEEWLRTLAETDTGGQPLPMQFFLFAGALMPRLSVEDEEAKRANEWASVNGLVLVQHGATRSGRRLASRIAVTNKIKHGSTGEMLTLVDRTLVFDALRQNIVNKLRFTSIQVFKDGHAEEDCVQLMTDAAAKIAASGFFVRMAGGRVSQRR